MYDPHATSSTFSATVTQYGGYRQALDGSPSLNDGFGPSQIITAPSGGVAFDAVGPSPAGASSAGLATLNWSHTCTGSNLYVVVGIAVDGNPDTTAAVTYAGTAMLSLGKVYSNGGVGGYAQLFGLANPPTGTSTVAVTLPDVPAFGIEGGSISFTGVHQASPVGAAVSAFGSGGSATVTVPATTAGNMVVDVIAAGSAVGTSGQTARWLLNLSNAHYTAANSAQSTAAAGTSVVMSYPVSPSDFWGLLAVEVQSVANGANSTAGGFITLGGTASATAAASVGGALTLGGSTAAAVTAGSAGSVALAGGATAAAPVASSGSVTLSGTSTATARDTAAGTVTLGGTSTAATSASAAGTITLAGTAAAAAPATAAGGVTLGATGTAAGPSAASGTVSLTGTATPAARATTAGAVTLSGTASGAQTGTSTATGTIALGGSAQAAARPSALTGVIVLGGTATPAAAATATGAITLGGNVAGQAASIAAGLITLGGAVAAAVPATTAGLIFLSGLANGQDGSGPVVLAGPNETLSVGPERRTVAADAPDRRTLQVAGESRRLQVAADQRTDIVPAVTRESATVGS